MGEIKNCYVKTPRGAIVNGDFCVNYNLNKPFYVYEVREGFTPFALYDFAFTYDDMVKKLVKRKNRKSILSSNKDAYLHFIESKTIGTKIYTTNPDDKKEWLELTWDGELFICGKHMFYTIEDLLNEDLYFQKPEGVNIITEWIRKNHIWCDKQKSWIPLKK
jgi:hypothetical protein